MKKLNKNEKGFSAVEFVMVIVIIVLIIAVGWLVYKDHHKTSATTTSKTTNSSTTSSTIALTQTYSDPSGFSFKYPASWERINPGNSYPVFVPTILSSQLSLGLLIVSTDTYSSTPQAYLSTQNSNTSGTSNTLALADNKSITINGYTANYGIGTNDGGNDYGVYQVFDKGKVATLSFLISTPSNTYSSYSTDEAAIANSVTFTQ